MTSEERQREDDEHAAVDTGSGLPLGGSLEAEAGVEALRGQVAGAGVEDDGDGVLLVGGGDRMLHQVEGDTAAAMIRIHCEQADLGFAVTGEQ